MASSSYSGRFQIKVEADGRSRLVRLRLGVATVGRSASNTIHLDQRNISRRHVRFIRKKKHVYAEDMQSANGTLVNGEPLVGRRRIFREDVIRIGDVNLELVGNLDCRDEETTERTVRRTEQTEIVSPPRPSRQRERTLIVRRRRRSRRGFPWVAIAVLIAATLLSATVVGVYVIRVRESRQNVTVLELEEIPVSPER